MEKLINKEKIKANNSFNPICSKFFINVLYSSQMKLALFIVAVACVAACCAEPESVREKRQSQKPGRFLSLPVAQKCANRKCYVNI